MSSHLRAIKCILNKSTDINDTQIVFDQFHIYINLFLVSFYVKETPLYKDHPDASLEEQIGPCVLGQVGSDLILGSTDSVFFPNSLGLICMETKVRTGSSCAHKMKLAI